MRRKHRLSLDTVASVEELQRFESRLSSVQHNIERIDLSWVVKENDGDKIDSLIDV